MSGTATFVLCIEDNAICAQALLLCESIRAFGGKHRGAPIFAIAPRPGLGIDQETEDRLHAMHVDYIEEPLNLACPVYGSANRVFAAAWAEKHAATDWIVVLDSDTVMLDELQVPPEADAAVRPVDMKGCATTGPGDPFEEYWAALAGLQGISLDCLPFLCSTVCGQRIRASYNGGLVVVRRETGILAAWAALFARSVEAGLKPWSGRSQHIRSSTGLVGPEASEYWGSNQAAAALAIWSTTRRVFHYPDAYNVPLHALAERPALRPRWGMSALVHVHYHWLFTGPCHQVALATLRDLRLGTDRLDWLAARLPLEERVRP